MYEIIALICIVIFFQIVIYKIGYMQGEQSAYKRFTKKYSPSGNSATLEYKSKIRIFYFLHIENNKYSSMTIIALPIMSIYVLMSQIFIICLCFCTHYKFSNIAYMLTFRLSTNRYGNRLKQCIRNR